MLVIALIGVAVAAFAFLRPRRSSLVVATVPAALAFLWLLGNDDDRLTAEDIGWYAGMSTFVGLTFGVVAAAGLLLGQAARRRRSRASP